MVRVDLHVHSSYSEHPSEWFLQRLGARESYVDPEEVYAAAKKAGMDFVTITDHNSIEGVLALRDRHPNDVFTGVEVTTYFPEDNTKIHLLVWNLDVKQFSDIDSLRQNIYELRNYIIRQDLPHAIAHPTFAINRSLTLDHIEKLLVLFDYFEGINGSRGRAGNEVFTKLLYSLTPKRFAAIAAKHGLTPRDSESWTKGVVGGSDDHSGLFIGKTWTRATLGDGMADFLDQLRRKRTETGGRHNDYRGLTFAVYKIACDFSQSRNLFTTSLLATVNRLIFDEKPLGLKERFTFEKIKHFKAGSTDTLRQLFTDLVETFRPGTSYSSEEKLEILTGKVSNAADELLRVLCEQLSIAVSEGDFIGVIQAILGLVPGAFMTIPFFSAINVMHASRGLLDDISRHHLSSSPRLKRILWFTDTLTDLNGVSETLQEIGWLAHKKGYELRLATYVLEGDPADNLPPNVFKPILHRISIPIPRGSRHCSIRSGRFANSIRMRSTSRRPAPSGCWVCARRVFSMCPARVYITPISPVNSARSSTMIPCAI
jgi:predicted metal-dependent phosphoesterase TrpH